MNVLILDNIIMDLFLEGMFLIKILEKELKEQCWHV